MTSTKAWQDVNVYGMSGCTLFHQAMVGRKQVHTMKLDDLADFFGYADRHP